MSATDPRILLSCTTPSPFVVCVLTLPVPNINPIKCSPSRNVTVTNLGAMDNDLGRVLSVDLTMSFKLLVSGRVDRAPCPRLGPNEPECGGHGTCGHPPVVRREWFWRGRPVR